jgi:hypothetical protein
MYQSTPYEPVELQCGDRLLISWERGVHNLVQDVTGALGRLAGRCGWRAAAVEPHCGGWPTSTPTEPRT